MNQEPSERHVRIRPCGFFLSHRTPKAPPDSELQQQQQLKQPHQCQMFESWLTCDRFQRRRLHDHYSRVHFFMRTGWQITAYRQRWRAEYLCSCVATICLPSITIVMTCSDRNVNNSFLLSSERKKSCQFRGTVTDGRTLLLAPVPLFSLVHAFKLLGMYSSHTKSTLWTFFRDFVMYGRKTFSLYFLKGFTELRFQHLNADCTVQYENCRFGGFYWTPQFVHTVY